MTVETPHLNSTASGSNSKRMLAVIVLTTVVLRGGVLLLMPAGLSHDTDQYRNIAETIHTQRVFGFGSNPPVPPQAAVPPTAFRPPLYPLLLSIFVTNGKLAPAAVGFVHVVCGVLTVAIIWILGVRWGLGKWANFAALLTALDPILLFQSTQLMTETLAALTAVLALWWLTKWMEMEKPVSGNALVAGVVLGLACLCRPTFLPWSGLVVVYGLCRKVPLAPRLQSVAVLLIGLGLTLLPWGWRNYVQLGQFRFTTTHGGYTLLLANNPDFYRFLRDGNWRSVWDSKELDEAWSQRGRIRDANDELLPPEPKESDDPSRPAAATIHRTEFQDDQLAYDFARRFIREDPAMFVQSSLYRMCELWGVLPHRVADNESAGRRLMRYGVAIWNLGMYCCCAVGIWKLRAEFMRPPWLWGLLLCVSFTAVHAGYWSNMRMRAPLVPFLALVAAAGVRAAEARRAVVRR